MGGGGKGYKVLKIHLSIQGCSSGKNHIFKAEDYKAWDDLLQIEWRHNSSEL